MSPPVRRDATSVAEATAVVAVPSPDNSTTTAGTYCFETLATVEVQGPNRRVGFGGFSMAVAVRTACATVDVDAFRLYSVLGTFLGPAAGTKKLRATVTPIRDTRTFATRRVDLYQDEAKEGGGEATGGGKGLKTTTSGRKGSETTTEPPSPSSRIVMTLTADFMRPEPRSLLAYSRPLRHRWSGPDDSVTFDQAAERALAAGAATPAQVDEYRQTLGKTLAKFDRRSAPEGWFGQTALGMHAGAEGSVAMDAAAHPTEKGTAEWYRPLEATWGYVDSLCSMAYVLDHGISLNVSQWNRIAPHDIGAVSSLEFAMRFMVPSEMEAASSDGGSGGKDTSDGSKDTPSPPSASAAALPASSAAAAALCWGDGWLLREGASLHAGGGRTFNVASLRAPRDPASGESAILAHMTQQCILRPAAAAKASRI